jgi:hypothetical protein
MVDSGAGLSNEVDLSRPHQSAASGVGGGVPAALPQADWPRLATHHRRQLNGWAWQTLRSMSALRQKRTLDISFRAKGVGIGNAVSQQCDFIRTHTAHRASIGMPPAGLPSAI